MALEHLSTSFFYRQAPAAPMSTAQPSPSRKRLRSQPSSGHVAPSDAKRLKRCDSSSQAFSPHYLDFLSKVWLTKEALRLLDRRTKRHAQSRPGGRRPLAQGPHAPSQNESASPRTPAVDFLKRATPSTLKELKLFARHGGPDLSDLTGYPEPPCASESTMSSMRTSHRNQSMSNSSTNSRSAITKTTGSSGASDPAFHQRMIDNRIFPAGYEYPDGRLPPEPENFDELHQMLGKRRPSLSQSAFSREQFAQFKRAGNHVTSEYKATEKVLPMIQGTIRNPSCVEGNILFNNIATMFPVEDERTRIRLAKQGEGEKVKLRTTKPDVYYGARPEQLHLRIRDNDELGKFIVPSTTTHRACAPNFFVEAKGPSGSAMVALDQACFAGAIGARGIHSLQNYGQEPTFDNKSYTLTATYHDGQLKMYAHHCRQPDGPGTATEYYMELLNAWALGGTRETCIQGMTAFRNAVAWTEAQRNAAIEHANTVVKQTDNDHVGNDDGQVELLNVTSPASTFTPQSPVFKGPIAPSKGKAPCREPSTSASANELGLGSQWTCPPAPPSFVRGVVDGEPPRALEPPSTANSAPPNLMCGGSVPEQPRAPLCDGSVSAASRSVLWVWKDGAYRNYYGNTLVQSQNSQPHDVWVFCEMGWPDGDGKQWRCFWSATRQLQFQ